MEWMGIVKLIVHSLVQILIPFAIIFFAYVIRERFGKDLSDKYLEAAGIGVKRAEQLSKTTPEHLGSKIKKETAMQVAKKVLQKMNINENDIDMELLDDVVESVVYELNAKESKK